MRQSVRHCLNTVLTILSNETFDPIPFVSIEEQVFCASNQEPVYLKDIGAPQLSWRGLESWEGQVRFCTRQPHIGPNANGKIWRKRHDAVYRRIQIRRDGVPLGNVVSGQFSYANGLDKVEVIRPDGRIAGADPAMLAVTGQVGVRFADTSLLDLAVAGTPIELVFEWSIAAGKLLRFTVHNVNLPKPKLPITGPAGVQATFDWQASEHPVLAKTCTATLVNDLSAY